MKYPMAPKGVALIQVLLLTGIIMILVLQLTKESRTQVQTANQWKDKTDLSLQLNNATEVVLFNLLVNNRQNSSDSEVTRKWNFHGKPFVLNDATKVAIEDEAGKLSLMYSADDLVKLNVSMGQTLDAVRRLIAY
jgi:general secretion pathway protein K